MTADVVAASRCERPRGGPARRLLAVGLGLGLVLTGCGGPPEEGTAGPVGDSVVTPRPITVEWAGSLCRTLDPVFDALRVPPAAAEPGADPRELLERVGAALAALEVLDEELPEVGPPPSAEAMAITERIADRLDALRIELGSAADGLDAALAAGDQAAVELATADARAALASFDRDAVPDLLAVDPEVANAPAFAPACAGGS